MSAPITIPAPHSMYVESEYDVIPVSLEAALDEQRTLVANTQQIQAALQTANLSGDYDPVWRRRAADAKRHMDARKRFLRQWLHDNRPGAGVQIATALHDLDEVSTTALVRAASKRIGALESIYVASVQLLNDDTDKNRADWAQRVRDAMTVLPRFWGEA